MAIQRPNLLISFPSYLLRQSVYIPSLRRGGLRVSEKCRRWQSTEADPQPSADHPTPPEPEPSPDISHLDPAPDDYSRFLFQDNCRCTVQAGSGGSGCVSFLREKYIAEGPPNGGDGGSGGNVYIQAVEGLTSLHKLARTRVIKAKTGSNGKGKSRGGKRGDDVLIKVPVGTVVRELDRYDPVAVELERWRESRAAKEGEDVEEELGASSIRHDRWVLYPGANPSDFLLTKFPNKAPRRPYIAAMEPQAPIYLDLSQHMPKPMLLAAGAVGGFGNPHFISRDNPRPKFASRGERGTRLELEFELKLLADVGLVGKPNAGKSTLLRSLTNSRTRIGNWEFTTLTPSIGTVVIDDYKGRPLVEAKGKVPRTNFTIADIPGLIEDAHLDKGLGLGFLRHVERAGILAFVVDLSAGDPVQGLKNLWHELGQYQRLRDEEILLEGEGVFPSTRGLPELDSHRADGTESHVPMNHQPNTLSNSGLSPDRLTPLPIHRKPWFVVATKADLPETQSQFKKLVEYIADVENGREAHPGGREDGWKEKLYAVPVSAKRGEGVSRIPKMIMEFLD
ncbi:GTP-Binding protein [Aspergillus sclerotialis]|uniref:GTP-Binding protein n=1 Tax=Aspergillus sclerotialis TaxID=2070753 RepID=A0A3A2ZAE4_9EURO|nr:GTP-Binding protein [Aspergillus sclerotialis]